MALNLDYDHAWKPDAPTSAGPDFDFDPNWKPAPEPKGGLVASAKQAIGSTIKGAGQAAADFLPGVDQDNALKRYGQGVVDANPTAVSSLADLKDKPLTGIAEATGNAGGSMGAMLGARALGMGITAASPLAGPAAPLIAGLGQAVSWAGPAAAAALPSFGGIREKQIQDDPTRQDSVGSKLLAAAGAGTVGLIESKLGPNKWAEMALSKQGRDALAEKFVANSLAGSIAKGAAKGAAIEGAEELAQNPIEQLASYQNPLTAENLKDTAFSGVMGAMGGGVLGGASGAAFRGNPEKPGQNPDATPGDQSIPYSPTTVEEVAKARAEAMGIKPENGPLSVASGMAIEAQTAEEMRLSTPGILAQGAAAAEQARLEQEARQAAEPGIPYEPVSAEAPQAANPVPLIREALPAPSGSFSQMDDLAQLVRQERADKDARLAELSSQQQASRAAADAYREERLAEIDQTIADNRQRQSETVRLDLLHGILSDAEVANPAEKFSAELARQGYRNTAATPQESAAIQRHGELKQAFAGWQNPATQGPKEGFKKVQDSADFYDLLGREKADLEQRRAALQKPAPAPQPKDKHQAVADLVAAGATMKGRDLVSPTGKVVMKNLNLMQAAKARQFIRERNTNPTPPNAQTAETPAPAQAVQAEAQGSQQQPAVAPAQDLSSEAPLARPNIKESRNGTDNSLPNAEVAPQAPESGSPVVQGGANAVDARAGAGAEPKGRMPPESNPGVGQGALDANGEVAEQPNPAEPDSGVPDVRTGGSSGLVAKRPTPSKPEGSSIDRAVRTLMDRTNGNGSPDGLIGPENQDARAEIISALTGKPAESLSVLEKSLSAMETQLHRAAGITEGSIKERRSRFIDWIDSRSAGAEESAAPSTHQDPGQPVEPVTPAVRPASQPADVQDAPNYDADDLIRSVANVIRQTEPMRSKKRPDGRHDITVGGRPVAVMDAEPKSANEALVAVMRNYADALRAQGKQMPRNPADMTRDQFVAANELGGLLTDFEVDSSLAGVKSGADGTFGIDHDALYDRIQAQGKKSNPEPAPLDFTPKQYHDARMKWVAREYGLSDAEVRSDYDTDAARKADDGAWTEAVRQAFKDGAELSRATLDKLEEIRPGALSAFLHDYPDAKVPNGYQTPSARKAESEKQDALRSDRKAIAEEFAANKPLESIFAGLDSSSVRKANKAKKAAKAHPLADKIQNVQDNFLDILQELEDSGKVKINC